METVGRLSGVLIRYRELPGSRASVRAGPKLVDDHAAAGREEATPSEQRPRARDLYVTAAASAHRLAERWMITQAQSCGAQTLGIDGGPLLRAGLVIHAACDAMLIARQINAQHLDAGNGISKAASHGDF